MSGYACLPVFGMLGCGFVWVIIAKSPKTTSHCFHAMMFAYIMNIVDMIHFET